MSQPVAAALVVLFATLGAAIAPSSAAACCADAFEKVPVGWSDEGALLVTAYDAAECNATLTAEVHAPFGATSNERFDLQDGGRRLRGGRRGVEVNVWDALDDADVAGDLDRRSEPMPAALRRRFLHPVDALCAQDLLVEARPAPGEAAGTSPWDARLRVSISVATNHGLVELAGDIEVNRMSGNELTFSVLPSPDGAHAVIRMHLDNCDAVGDELIWVRLPQEIESAPGTAGLGASLRPGCDSAAVAIPSPGVASHPDPEEANFLLSSIAGPMTTLGDDEEDWTTEVTTADLARVLWARPGDPALRAYLVTAFEDAGWGVVARAVAIDLPRGPRPALRDAPIERLPPPADRRPSPTDQSPPPELAVTLAPKVAPAIGASLDEAPGTPQTDCVDGGCAWVRPGSDTGGSPADVRANTPACGGPMEPGADGGLGGSAIPALFVTLGLGLTAVRRRQR